MNKKEQVREPQPDESLERVVELATAQEGRTQELLEKNLKWSQLIYEQNKRIQTRLTLMVVGNYLRLLLVLVPLILAFIYLPPIFSDVMSQYQSILSGSGTLQLPEGVSTEAVNEVLDQFRQ